MVNGFAPLGVDIQIWFTEYDMSHKDAPVHGKWLQGLYVSALALYFRESDNITHNTFHAMTGDAIQGAFLESAPNQFDFAGGFCSQCAALTATNNPLTAMGHCLSFVNKAFSLNAPATPLEFTNCGIIKHKQNGINYSYDDVYGWQFETTSADETQAIIINMSSHPYTAANGNAMQLSGANLFPNGGNFEMLTTDPDHYIAGNLQYDPTQVPPCSTASNFLSTTGTFTNQGTIDIPKFSITRLFYHTPNTGITATAVNPVLCDGEVTTLWTTGEDIADGWTYSWTPAAGLNNAAAQYPVFTAGTTTTFTVTATEPGGIITHTATVTVTVNTKNPVAITANPSPSCIGTNVTLSIPAGYSNTGWTTDGGSIASNVTSVAVTPLKPSNYFVYAKDGNGCYSSDHIVLPAADVYFDLGENVYLCTGEQKIFSLPAGSGQTYTWQLNGVTFGTVSSYTYQSAVSNGELITATVTQGGCSYTDDVWVYAHNCCTIPAADLIHSGDPVTILNSITSGTVYYDPALDRYNVTNATIEIHGVWDVSSTVDFTRCSITMQPGAKINLLPYRKLYLKGTTIQGCNKLWQAIHLHPLSRLITASAGGNNTRINDAENAVFADDFSYFDIRATDFDKDFIGINTPSNSVNITSTNRSISNARFIATGNLLPPYQGMIAVPGIKPYAGMVINNTIMTVGITGQPVNQFGDNNYSIFNGIISNNSTLIVSNSKFLNITNGSSILSKPLSAAIKASGQGGFYSLVVSPQATSTTNPFENCDRGIYLYAMSFNMEQNRLINCKVGVISSSAGLRTFDVSHNRIEASMFGIASNYSDAALNDNIFSNLVFINNPANTGYNSVGISSSSYGVTPSNLQIINNTVHVYSYSNSGIGLFNIHSPLTGCNTVFLHNTYHDEASASLTAMDGIGSYNVTEGELANNSVIGTSALQGGIENAMHLRQSQNNYVHCNVTDNTHYGFLIEDDCTTEDGFEANEIHNHWEGVHINSNGLIGNQDHRGNRWLGNYGSTYGIVKVGGSVLSNQFFVFTGSLPEYFTNASPSTIFQPTGSGSEATCTGLPVVCNQKSLRSANVNDAEYQLASGDSLQLPQYRESTNFRVGQGLFSLLNNNQNLISNYTLTNFFTNNSNSTIGNLDAVANKTKQGDMIDSNVIFTLRINDSLIFNYLHGAAFQDSIILVATGTDSINAVNCKHSLLENIARLSTVNSAIIRNLDSVKNAVADEAITLNNAVATQEKVYADNEKFINDVYLNTFAKGITTFSTAQQQTIAGIAVQCPFEGGRAVTRARAMWLELSDSIIWNDNDACIPLGYLRNLIPGNYVENSLKVTPVPGTNSITFSYDYCADKGAMVLLENSESRQVAKLFFAVKTNSYVLDISTWAAGKYFYAVIQYNAQIDKGRFEKVK